MNERFLFKQGAIGGLLGVNGGAGGTGFAGPAQADQTGMNNLNQSYNQLQQVAQGQGPNPAMAQYNQNVQNLAKQQSGAIASIQGISPALAARMASQQGSAALQNAAAQGATTQAEQQLGAMGAAGNIAGMQAGTSAQMQGNINNVNSSLANTTMQNMAGMVGGGMNAAGKAAAAEGGMVQPGGMVRPMAAGGSVGPQSSFMKYLSGVNGPSGTVQDVSPYAPANPLASKPEVNVQPASKTPENAGQGPTVANNQSMGAGIPYAQPTYLDQNKGLGFGAAPAMAKGGKVPALVSPGEVYIPPGKMKQAVKGNPLAAGEKIPGKPKVPGNSYANDTVPKTLESGGVVIPNSIMQSNNPAQGAKDFISDIISKRKARK